MTEIKLSEDIAKKAALSLLSPTSIAREELSLDPASVSINVRE